MFRSVQQRVRNQQQCCTVQMRGCITVPNENLGTCQRSTLEITNNLCISCICRSATRISK